MKRVLGYFSFKGVDSRSMHVHLTQFPTRQHPKRRGEDVAIPARDGTLFIDEGCFDKIIIKATVVSMGDNIDEVMAWLSGSGDLVFSDEPERAYHARVVKEYTRDAKIQRFTAQTFTVIWDCDPFRYEVVPEKKTFTKSAYIVNVGTVQALPLIHVVGNGDINITCGSTMVLSDVEDDIWLDCSARVAYKMVDGVAMLQNHKVSIGAWCTLGVGNNSVGWLGDVSSVEVQPNWRWL